MYGDKDEGPPLRVPNISEKMLRKIGKDIRREIPFTGGKGHNSEQELAKAGPKSERSTRPGKNDQETRGEGHSRLLTRVVEKGAKGGGGEMGNNWCKKTRDPKGVARSGERITKKVPQREKTSIAGAQKYTFSANIRMLVD